jgi:hypothetical protein
MFTIVFKKFMISRNVQEKEFRISKNGQNFNLFYHKFDRCSSTGAYRLNKNIITPPKTRPCLAGHPPPSLAGCPSWTTLQSP